jgi:hypothetical protein
MTEEAQWAKEREERIERITAEATAADLDTEDKLLLLQRLTEDQRRLRIEYEALRDDVVELLEGQPRYFISESGAKWYATVEQTEPLKVDLELLLEEIDSEELLDEIAPRKVNTTAFKQAVMTGRISNETLLKVGKLSKNRPFVKFHFFDSE